MNSNSEGAATEDSLRIQNDTAREIPAEHHDIIVVLEQVIGVRSREREGANGNQAPDAQNALHSCHVSRPVSSDNYGVRITHFEHPP